MELHNTGALSFPTIFSRFTASHLENNILTKAKSKSHSSLNTDLPMNLINSLGLKVIHT